jgi:IclR family acetate operon transcriptional repressor
VSVAQTPQSPVKSAMRTLDLIEYVVARPSGVVAQEISAALAIPVSSLSYLLATLVERSYLQRVGRHYFAGPGLDRLRQAGRESTFAERAGPLIKAMRLQLNETASLFERDGWELMVVVTATSEQTLRYALDEGTRTPLHCIAAGRAVLAALTPSELERYFDETDRQRFTDHTTCDREALLEDLARVKERGYARVCDEFSLGICAIGAALCIDGEPVAAVSVAVPSPRFDARTEREVIDQVLKAKRALEELAG